MVRNHMSETLKAAVTYIEQGHVRVGPELVTDPAFLVTRSVVTKHYIALIVLT